MQATEIDNNSTLLFFASPAGCRLLVTSSHVTHNQSVRESITRATTGIKHRLPRTTSSGGTLGARLGLDDVRITYKRSTNSLHEFENDTRAALSQVCKVEMGFAMQRQQCVFVRPGKLCTSIGDGQHADTVQLPTRRTQLYIVCKSTSPLQADTYLQTAERSDSQTRCQRQ